METEVKPCRGMVSFQQPAQVVGTRGTARDRFSNAKHETCYVIFGKIGLVRSIIESHIFPKGFTAGSADGASTGSTTPAGASAASIATAGAGSIRGQIGKDVSKIV